VNELTGEEESKNKEIDDLTSEIQMLTQKTLARTAEEKKTNEENQKQTAIELTKEGLLPEPDEESAGSSK